MTETTSSVNQTVCHIREVEYSLAVLPCDRYQHRHHRNYQKCGQYERLR